MDREKLLTEARERYGEALVLGESVLARAVIDQALGRGLSRAEVYLEVLTPTQIRLGEMWHEGSINVAQEHLATTITMDMMDYLRQGMTARTGLGSESRGNAGGGRPAYYRGAYDRGLPGDGRLGN